MGAAVGGAAAAQDGIVMSTISASVIWSGGSLPFTQASMAPLSGTPGAEACERGRCFRLTPH
jgi:hypothetical protein